MFSLLLGFIIGNINIHFLIFSIKFGIISNNDNYCIDSYTNPLLIIFFPIFSSLYFLFFLYDSSTFDLHVVLLIYMSIILSFGDIISLYVIPECFWVYSIIIISLYVSDYTFSFLKCLLILTFYCCSCCINHILNGNLGLGDIKLFCLWFLIIGIPYTLNSILFSSLIGIIFIISSRHPKNQPIPFVPFLSIGLIIASIFN